jgi:hypothetical protein
MTEEKQHPKMRNAGDTQPAVSVLLLAADSGEGGLGEMIDPTLRAQFALQNVHFCASYFSDFDPGALEGFHAVMLLRAPIPDHPLDDYDAFMGRMADIRTFVARGGGLFVLFTECYGKTVAPLNDALAPWNIHFYFNQLKTQNPEHVERLARLHESRILPAQCCRNPFFTPSSETLGLLTEGGHGTQHLTCVPAPGSAWAPLLRGGEHMVSQPYARGYINTSFEPIRDPILAAGAEIDAGRVLCFPGSAPFWVVNSHIWRFNGYLHEQRNRAGFEFFLRGLRWMAASQRNQALSQEAQRQAAAQVDEKALVKPRYFSFHGVSDSARLHAREGVPRRIWIGSVPGSAVSDNGITLPPDGKDSHHAFPLLDYRQVEEQDWEQAWHATGNPELSARLTPGYELIDDEGMHLAVIGPKSLPNHSLHHENPTLLESVWVPLDGVAAIVRNVLRNRIPLQRYGGYNLVEWDPDPEWQTVYRRLIASKYPVGPVRISTKEARDVQTWVLPAEDESAFDALSENRHQTFVSSGPRIERFDMEGPRLIDDEWEGYWYGYLPGDEATVHVRIVADAPLERVTLWDGEQKLAEAQPGNAVFDAMLPVALWRDLRLHLTASDVQGGELFAGFPLYTRNLHFWGHVGSDQMNNYVNPMQPSERGFLGVDDTFYDPFGFATFGAGWGDYIRMTPSIPYSEFMPRQEVSLVIGSFNTHHPSVLLPATNGMQFLNDHRRVFDFCGADAQAFYGTIAGACRHNAEAQKETWHDREIVPTRILVPPDGRCNVQDEYVVWRWKPGEPILIEVIKHIEADPGLLKEEWLTYAVNAHYLLPDLRVRSVADPARGFRVEDLPVQQAIRDGGKDWDHTPAFGDTNIVTTPFFVDAPGDIQVGNGGAGTFGLFPLGITRPHRALLVRTDNDLHIAFQCTPTHKERDTGQLTIRYLMALDAAETEDTPFSPLAGTIEQATKVAAERVLSITVDLSDATFPLKIDLNERFPALEHFPLRLRISGLPPGLVRWTAQDTSETFASQPINGRSYHLFEAGNCRRYTLEHEPPPTWKDPHD